MWPGIVASDNDNLKKITKRTFYYYCLLAEEGIAYYLTYKWPLILFGCLISIFPTIMVCWTAQTLLNVRTSWELIFFIIWFVVMIGFFIEFPLPENIKEKVRQKINEQN